MKLFFEIIFTFLETVDLRYQDIQRRIKKKVEYDNERRSTEEYKKEERKEKRKRKKERKERKKKEKKCNKSLPKSSKDPELDHFPSTKYDINNEKIGPKRCTYNR